MHTKFKFKHEDNVLVTMATITINNIPFFIISQESSHNNIVKLVWQN